MLLDLIEMANKSQGLATWSLVMVLIIMWLKLHHKVDKLQTYLTLKLRLFEERITHLKGHVTDLKEEWKNDR